MIIDEYISIHTLPASAQGALFLNHATHGIILHDVDICESTGGQHAQLIVCVLTQYMRNHHLSSILLIILLTP